MLRGKKRLIVGGMLALALLVGAAGAVMWNTLIPHDVPEQATVAGAIASLDTAQSATAAGAEASALAGTWVLAQDGQSFVGYRVREQLASIGAFTAVGRTSDVTATLVFDGNAITDVRVEADLTTLTSDNSMRDGQLRRQALETNTYPMATFALMQPIVLNGVPADGVTISATAVGDLTLHGVTRSVSVSLDGQLTGGYVVVAGSMDIAFADFGIARPASAAVLSIEDRGVMELQLVFEQGTRG
jgi:polyisoprenoid-binding protein YceI